MRRSAMDEAEEFLVGEEHAHSYFVPIVDMLAGVVFLLVIMLAASLLVSRPEFGQTEQMQAEIAKITKELQDAKAAQKRYIDPRRQAHAAMGVLLDRLSAGLRGAGFSVYADPDQGTLTIKQADLFGANGTGLSDSGKGVANVLAQTLSQELPCLSRTPPANMASCAAYGGARLDSAILSAPQNPSNLARAQALQLLAVIVAANPRLLALEAPDGTELVTYGAGGAASSDPPEGGSPEPAAIALHFQMNIPAIP